MSKMILPKRPGNLNNDTTTHRTLGLPRFWLGLVAIFHESMYKKVISFLIHHISHRFVGQRKEMGRCPPASTTVNSTCLAENP